MNAYKAVNGEWVVSERISMSTSELEGSVDEIKAALDAVRDRAAAMGMVGEGRVDISVSSGYYNNDYDLEIEYYFIRAENTVERDDRLAREARIKDEAKAKRKAAAEKKRMKADAEYVEYERLRAKFGG
jgi:hypothetical protein